MGMGGVFLSGLFPVLFKRLRRLICPEGFLAWGTTVLYLASHPGQNRSEVGAERGENKETVHYTHLIISTSLDLVCEID